MSKIPYLILGRNRGTLYRPGSLDPFELTGESAESLADQCIDAMRQTEPDLGRLVLLLSSELVLVHPVDAEKAKLKNEELSFELESLFPIDVEDMLPLVHGKSRPLAMVVSREHVETFVLRIQEAGGRIDTVAPVTTQILEQLNRPRTQEHQQVVVRDGRADVLDIESHQIVKWRIYYDFDQLIANLPSTPAEGSRLIDFGDVEHPAIGQLAQNWERIPANDQLIAESAAAVASRKAAARVDFLPLMGGFSEPRSFSLQPMLIPLMCILLAASTCALFLHSQRMSGEIDHNREQTQLLLETTIPNAPSTQLVQRTLQSERSKLSAQLPIAVESQNSTWIIANLTDILSAAPQDFSIQFSQLEVLRHSAKIAGTATNPSTLDRLCQHLREQGLLVSQKGSFQNFVVDITGPVMEASDEN